MTTKQVDGDDDDVEMKQLGSASGGTIFCLIFARLVSMLAGLYLAL